MYRSDIERSLAVLHRGGIILYPTDTVWGIGCDAACDAAVQRIYTIKQRSDTRAMLALVSTRAMLETYVGHAAAAAAPLIQRSPVPLTVIYPAARGLAASMIAADGSAGIRIVRDTFCRQLITAFGHAIVSTSANISGQPAPTTFASVATTIIAAADYTVLWRQNDRTPATVSSIIKLNANGSTCVLR